jgi:hypothetical protein
MRHSSLLAATLIFSVACGPQLGDSCKTATDCSIQGNRICDKSQPGGYCTIANCDKGGCGDGEGVCVRFRPDEPRLSVSYCMKECSDSSDCRDAFGCRTAAQLNAKSAESRVAEVVDTNAGAKFCVLKE